MLDGGGIKLCPIPFHFENVWLLEGFKDMLRFWWQNLNFKGFFSFVLTEKLKPLKGILKIWNKDVFGRVEVKKSDALRKINHWDVKEKDNLLTLEETEERNLAREDYK